MHLKQDTIGLECLVSFFREISVMKMHFLKYFRGFRINERKKIIIGVAPTGGGGRGNHNPVDPDVIADDVIKSCQEGACIAHMHARDENGILTKDLTSFSYAVEKVKKSCNIILEASTGGFQNLRLMKGFFLSVTSMLKWDLLIWDH